MIEEPVGVQLALRNDPADVAIVRAALAGIAEAAELDAEYLADLKTAASEACNNVVLHAYGDDAGPMLVRIEARHDGVEVSVTDHGRGLTRISPSDERMGLGLAIISALATGAEFSTPPGGGTGVRMWFGRPTAVAPGESSVEWPQEVASLTGEVVTWVSPVNLGRYVLGRILRSVAAASRFSVTRVQELRAINDAIAAYAELAADGAIAIAVSSSSRELSVTSGPFVVPRPGAKDGTVVTQGRAEELRLRRDHLQEIVDLLSSERVDDHELLHLVLADASTSA